MAENEGQSKKCDDEKQCRHFILCRAQGEDFCLKEFNHQKHQEYRKRRQEMKQTG